MTTLATRPATVRPADAPCSPPSVVSAGGMLVRPALPGDTQALVAMHDRCSLETRTARWHAPIRGIPASYLAEVTACAPGRAALVAVKATQLYELIGLASACLVSPDIWELGMLIEDAYQRQGIGRAMLRVLVDDVIRRGARELVAVSLDERRSILNNLRELGPVAFSAEATTVTARVLLPPR